MREHLLPRVLLWLMWHPLWAITVWVYARSASARRYYHEENAYNGLFGIRSQDSPCCRRCS